MRGSTEPDWAMMFEVVVRIPAGRLEDWVDFWGGQKVALLEESGQWLWGAWTGVTGRQNVVTHHWAYRDLTHFQAMADLRATSPAVQALLPRNVKVQEVLISSVLTRLAHHPATLPETTGDGAGVLVAQRAILDNLDPASAPEYLRLAEEYAARAASYGGRLAGAFRSYFGWFPAYLLHVWSHDDAAEYLAATAAIEADARCRDLLGRMRAILPNETIEIARPLAYSRLR